jgi:hypothetical protein
LQHRVLRLQVACPQDEVIVQGVFLVSGNPGKGTIALSYLHSTFKLKVHLPRYAGSRA